MFRRLVYQTKTTRRGPRPDDFVLTRGRVAVRGVRVNPGKPRGLVYYGGNAESVENRADVLADLLPDHTTYLVPYRGYGASGGRPTQPDLIGDALALHMVVAEAHPAAGIDVIGRSLGGAVALQVASRAHVRRLVLVTPFDSLAAVASDHAPSWIARLLVRDRWDSLAAALRVESPILVLRAGADTTVRPLRTDALLAAIPDSRVESFLDADHNTITKQPGYYPAIQTFLSHEDDG